MKTVPSLIVGSILLVLSFSAEAQQQKLPRIGFLSSSMQNTSGYLTDSFLRGLRDLRYVEGQNILLEYRWANGNLDELPKLAKDLLSQRVDVILVSGGTPGVLTVKKLTAEVPTIFIASSDPVTTGLVDNLARPGGNITGLTIGSPGLWGKRLEVMKEVVPTLSSLGLLLNPANPSSDVGLKETRAVAASLKFKLQPIEIRHAGDIESGFELAVKIQASALSVAQQPPITSYRRRVTELAIKNKLPAIYADREWPDAAHALMSYGPNIPDIYRRAATYVDKILKGAKPAELPIEQPTKFEFIINLKAAKQIGLTIPPNVLARADRVIK